MGRKRIFSDEHVAFIRENAKGLRNEELFKRFNEHFGTSFTLKQITNLKKENRIRSDVDTKFKKGHIPKTKGQRMTKKQYEKYKEAMFIRGAVALRDCPIGTERKVTGTVLVKVDDETWRFKHHLIWEKHHGEIPEGHVIMFADRNRNNFDIDNLLCVSKREQAVLNKFYKVHEDAELTKTSVLLTKLRLKSNERKNECKKKVKNNDD